MATLPFNLRKMKSATVCVVSLSLWTLIVVCVCMTQAINGNSAVIVTASDPLTENLIQWHPVNDLGQHGGQLFEGFAQNNLHNALYLLTRHLSEDGRTAGEPRLYRFNSSLPVLTAATAQWTRQLEFAETVGVSMAFLLTVDQSSQSQLSGLSNGQGDPLMVQTIIRSMEAESKVENRTVTINRYSRTTGALAASRIIPTNRSFIPTSVRIDPLDPNQLYLAGCMVSDDFISASISEPVECLSAAIMKISMVRGKTPIIWQTSLGGSNNEQSVVAQPVIAVGVSNDGKSALFSAASKALQLDSSGGPLRRAVVYRFNSDDGSIVWSQEYDGGNSASYKMSLSQHLPAAIEYDSMRDSLFLTGSSDAVEFYGQSNNGGKDMFIIRVSASNGSLGWSHLVGSTSQEHGADIVLMPDRQLLYTIMIRRSDDEYDGATLFLHRIGYRGQSESMIPLAASFSSSQGALPIRAGANGNKLLIAAHANSSNISILLFTGGRTDDNQIAIGKLSLMTLGAGPSTPTDESSPAATIVIALVSAVMVVGVIVVAIVTFRRLGKHGAMVYQVDEDDFDPIIRRNRIG